VSDSNKRTPALVEKFVIRLPNGLREQIKALSEQNRRSMNSEIIMVLEKHIRQFTQEDIRDFSTEELLQEVRKEQKNSHIKHLEHKQAPLTDQVLQERLEALPAEKKEALLELLG
jgi:predicted DNA-binding protein